MLCPTPGTFFCKYQTIRIATGCSTFKAIWSLFRSSYVGSKYDLEFASLERKSTEATREWADAYTTLENENFLAERLKQRRPVILVLASFSLHYFGLLAVRRLAALCEKITIAQPSEALGPLASLGFYAKLSKAIGITIHGVPSDRPTAMVAIGKALKRGGVVAMRVDGLPARTSSFSLSSLLGRPAMFPMSILLLARRYEADVIPFFVHCTAGRYVTTVGTPVEVRASASDTDISCAALKLDEQIGQAIRLKPGEYSGWLSVHAKWRLAEEVQDAVSSDGKEGAHGHGH